MATLAAGATLPLDPPGRTMVWRAYLSFVDSFRRTWRGWVATMFGIPVLNLLAFGYGLGHLIGQSSGNVDGVRYVAYLAPGLLAATAMQSATEEATWAVMTAIKWQRTYYAMLATPLTAGQVLLAHLLWTGTRVAMSAAVLLGLIAALGLGTWWTVLALPAAILTGLAFAGPVMAFSGRVESEESFAMLYRFGIVPLFLFSGTFFPISQLPSWLVPLAWVSPLWHGVDLCRDLVLGRLQWLDGLHVGYLAGLLVVGVWLADRSFRRRLVV
jgi:lipooligosaccharide transport system permease protein